MYQSLVKEFVLLNIAKEIDICSIIAMNSFLGTVAAGVFELEKSEIISVEEVKSDFAGLNKDIKFVIKNELPQRLYYLETLYKVMSTLEKQTMIEVLKAFHFDIKTNASANFVHDILNSLVKDSTIQESRKKGFLGREKSIYKTDSSVIEKRMENLFTSLKNQTITEQDLILLYLLMKSDLLKAFYTGKETTFIQEQIETLMAVDNSATSVMKLMDSLLLVLFSILAVLG